MSDVRKPGPTLQVATDEDGTPLCPQDGLRMVTDDDGKSWTCPIGVVQLDIMRRWAIGAFDRIVLDARP